MANVHQTIEGILDPVVARPEVGAVAIYVWSPGTERLEYAGGRGIPPEAVHAAGVRKGEGRIGVVASEGRAQVATLDRGDRRSALQQLGLVTRCVYPLVAYGELHGVLELYLNDEDCAQADFELLAAGLALALANAQLLEATDTRRDLEEAYDKTIEEWSRAVGLRDRSTAGHSEGVTQLTIKLARALGIEGEDLVHVRRGSLLHDVGKMRIPDAILHKRDKLSEPEWEIMRKHPVYGYEILSAIPFLHPAIDIPYGHHERWNGSGYPRGLQGEEIPLAARIFAVADVYHAMTSERPYRRAMPPSQVRSLLGDASDSLFDPDVVEAFHEVLPPGA